MLWIDDVIPMSHEDYDRATEDLLRVARGTNGITGVWQTGSVSVPGISDLDFLIVVRDGARVSWNRMKKSLSPETIRILLHSPVAITQSLLPWLGYVNDIRGYRRLEGKQLSFVEPENKAIVNLMVSARFVTAKLLGLMRTQFMGYARVRSFLCRVHGIRHNFTLMDMPVPSVFEEAAELRRSWLSLGQERYARLENLLAEAQDACVKFLKNAPVPSAIESGPDELFIENWRFYGGDGSRERRGMLSWLPRKGRLGEIAYYSTWFELGIAPGLSGLLSGTLAPADGKNDWEKHLEVIALSERIMCQLPGFSPPASFRSLRGWRRWVP
ncbi:MAG: hypothetical protein ABIM46_05400 [candidate division WOR-3 bacterium]